MKIQTVWTLAEDFLKGIHDFGEECLKHNYCSLIEKRKEGEEINYLACAQRLCNQRRGLSIMTDSWDAASKPIQGLIELLRQAGMQSAS